MVRLGLAFRKYLGDTLILDVYMVVLLGWLGT